MKIKSTICSLLLLILFIASSCNSSIERLSLEDELLEVDRAFSNLSKEKGMNHAFINYLAENSVLLRPNKMPLVGRDKIMESFSRPDTSFSLTWEPLFADVAESGELGYSYGIYKVEMYAPDGSPITSEGTYVSVWKKNEAGEWKFVLDTGNQGLGK
jgi:ketosteroid isomerase-like protein